MEEQLKVTCLHDSHVALGAKMSPFAGFDMPIQYSSITEEHLAVRNNVGMFDVSHMGEIFVSGPDAEKLAVQEKGKKGSSSDPGEGGGFDDKDEMLPAAIECVVEMGQASTSLLQRRLKLGYARAARIIDQMEEMGVVGPFEGSKPRQVLITKEQWLERKLASDEEQ